MNITYTKTLDGIQPHQLTGFFVGWPQHPDPETHLGILRSSYAICLAMDGERCIGFINTLSDGHFYAFIPLLEVLPEYQKRGIGGELLRRMRDTLSGMYAVDVVCDETVASYYKKLGFSRCVGMVQRNYANQKGGAGCLPQRE